MGRRAARRDRGRGAPVSYELQALVGDYWSWHHLASERVAASYPTSEAAEAARTRLIATTDWAPECVRIVEVRSHRRASRQIAITVTAEVLDRLDTIASRWGTTRSGAIARLTRAAQMP